MSENPDLPMLGVIMSVYSGDEPEHLERALSSIMSQHIPEGMQVRLYLGVDGPIGEGLEKVIAHWEGRIHRLRRFSQNRGLAHVLNDLIAGLGDEEFVFRMDADDIALPSRFGAQLDFMERHPDIGICGTAIRESGVDDELRVIRFPPTHAEAIQAIKWRSPFAHPTVCFRRSALEKLESYPTAASNEDIAMWFKAARLGLTFANLQEPHLVFRVAPGFWKRRGFAKAFGELQCYWSGLRSIGAPVHHFFWPALRFAFRLSPVWVRKLGYQSSARQ